jgi:PAS domain S-box-containing protein
VKAMSEKPTYEELEQQVKELKLEVASKNALRIERHKSVYRSMLENISDTVIVTDDYGYIIYVCPNTRINFGISVDEVYEFGTIDNMMNGELCSYSDLCKKGEISNIEWSIVHQPSGEKRYLLVSAKSINIFGGKVMYVMRNITERVQIIEQLKKSEIRFRALFEKAPVMVHSIDKDGRLLMVSNCWLEKMGYSRKEVIGRKSVDFLTEESRQRATNVILKQFFKDGQVTNVPYTMVKKNGETFDVLLSATSEKDSKGIIKRSHAVLIDVAHIIQANDAIFNSDPE